MNKIIILLLLIIAKPSLAQFTSANLQAAGLTCAMCSKAVNKSLEKLSFVQKVTSDIQTSSFIITFKRDGPVDFDALKKAVADAGFSIAKLKVTGNFSGIGIEKDMHVQIDGKTFHFINTGKQILDGEKTLVIADKDFISSKEFKKISAATKLPCIQTGKAGTCCIKDGILENTRVYHVTIG